MTDGPDDFEAARGVVRREMGGIDKVAALESSGRRTARGFIAEFFDYGSFVELGTLAAMGAGVPTTAAGDGRVTGHATLDGAPVGVIVDDVTVKRASSTRRMPHGHSSRSNGTLLTRSKMKKFFT